MNTDATTDAPVASGAPGSARTTNAGEPQAAPPAKKAGRANKAAAKKAAAKKAAVSQTAAPSPSRRQKATAEKSASAKKAGAVKKAGTAEKAASPTKAAGTKKAAAGKAAPARKAAPAKKAATPKTTATAKRATPAKKSAASKKTVATKKAAPARATGTRRTAAAAPAQPAVDLTPTVVEETVTAPTETFPHPVRARMAGTQAGHNIVPMVPGGLHTLKGLDQVGSGAWNGPSAPPAGSGARKLADRPADPPKVASARPALVGATKLQSRNAALDNALANKGIDPDTLTAEQYYAAHQDMALNGRLTSDPVTGDELPAGSGEDRIISAGARKGYLDRALRNFGVNPAVLTVAQYDAARRDYAQNQRITQEPRA